MSGMMRPQVVLLGVVVAAAVGALTACGAHPGTRAPAPSGSAVQPLVSISPSPPLPAGPATFARAALTPGSVNPEVTPATLASTICLPGWTASVRAVSQVTDSAAPWPVAMSGEGGTSMSGYDGTSTSGNDGTSTSGDDGTVELRWHDGTRYRIAVGYIGEDGLLPGVAYRCDSTGRIVPAQETA